MKFSCTRKVIQDLKDIKSITQNKYDIGIDNWYVDQLTVDRKKYYIFANSKTLFSFIAYMGKKACKLQLEERFINKLEETLIREITSNENKIKYFTQFENTYEYGKTNSPSIVKIIAHTKNQIKYDFYRMGGGIEGEVLANHHLNINPISTFNSKCPKTLTKIALNIK